MNDLLKLTNEMVKSINNTSNVTNTQNSTWKSPTQTQEDKLEQIHQQFLKSQEWGKNLTQKNSTVKTANSNSAKKRSKRECDGCDYNYIWNFKIRLMGADKKFRGNIYFDNEKKEINIHNDYSNTPFNLNNPNELFTGILFKDENGNDINTFGVTGRESMHDFIIKNERRYTKNINGKWLSSLLICTYKDGYTIHVLSSIATTTEFVKNKNNYWIWNSSNGEHNEKFTIWDDKMWDDDGYMQEYFPLIVTWHEINKIEEVAINRQIRDSVPHMQEWEKKDWQERKLINLNKRLETLETFTTLGKLDQRMVKVEKIIKKFEGKFTELNNKIKDISQDINALKNPNNNNALAKCATTTTAIGKIYGAFPVIGSAIEGLSWAISTGCNIANAYKPNRGKRDVSTIENKFDDSFLKSINQEQHLPSMTNHTNGVVKNLTTPLL